MFMRTLRLSSMVFAAIVLAANRAWALGFRLGETKEQLKLDYEVSVVDHGTGRVTVTLTIADEGRLKPLRSVDLDFPSKDKHKDGGYMADLWLSLATKKVDGKLLVSVHLKRELAEQAEIHLKTGSLDGKREALTWYYHAIPIAKYMKNGERKAANLAWAEGFRLGETKEQLKLKYDVSSVDHGTGRVTVTLTIVDQGKLKPLDSVDLVIPSKDGTSFVDLDLSLATGKVDGKLLARVHLKRELAERAEIHLKTLSLDGKKTTETWETEVSGWYFHAIPIAEYLKNGERKKD